MDLSALLPNEIEGWRPARPDESYDRTTIFRYMDGAAELYLSFDFRRLLVRRFQGEGPSEVTVELYDMGDAGDAFGIFSRNRGPGDAGIGQGSEIVSSYLFFWRGRYFVTLYPDSSTEESRRVVRAAGRAIAERIGRDGELPEILDLLPPEGLVPESIRFFHLHTDLDAHVSFGGGNPLGLDRDTDAALAAYGPLGGGEEGASAGSPSPLLLVVRYPSGDRASAALEACRLRFGMEAEKEAPAPGPDGTWSAAVQTDTRLIAVLDAPDGAFASRLIDRTRSRIAP